MVERRARSLSQSHGVYQLSPAPTCQAIGDERRPLRSLFGDLGETAYRNLLTEFRDTIVEDREPSPAASWRAL